MSGVVEVEVTVACVGDGAIGLCNLKIAVARDGEVQRVFSGLHIALRHDFLGGHDTHPRSQLEAGCGLRVSACLPTSLADVLVQQILKDRAVALKARRVDVGQVVGDHVHARLLRI